METLPPTMGNMIHSTSAKYQNEFEMGKSCIAFFVNWDRSWFITASSTHLTWNMDIFVDHERSYRWVGWEVGVYAQTTDCKKRKWAIGSIEGGRSERNHWKDHWKNIEHDEGNGKDQSRRGELITSPALQISPEKQVQSRWGYVEHLDTAHCDSSPSPSHCSCIHFHCHERNHPSNGMKMNNAIVYVLHILLFCVRVQMRLVVFFFEKLR